MHSVDAATMTAWVQKLRTVTDAHNRFVVELLAEEAGRPVRLRNLKEEIGLPVYDILVCDLPRQMDSFQRVCRKITRGEKWDLAVRVADRASGSVVIRHLGLKFGEAMKIARELGCGRYVATVLPYRTPARSGTLWVNHGAIWLDFIFGPHYALTQALSGPPEVLSCRFAFPQCSVIYSTNNPSIRRVLFETLHDTTQLVFGCRVKEVVEMELSVYAEFHWHVGLGYRFIECSFSKAWTSIADDLPFVQTHLLGAFRDLYAHPLLSRY